MHKDEASKKLQEIAQGIKSVRQFITVEKLDGWTDGKPSPWAIENVEEINMLLRVVYGQIRTLATQLESWEHPGSQDVPASSEPG